MGTVLVVDDSDRIRNTAIINGLHDPIGRVFVAHVPGRREELPTQLLLALTGTRDGVEGIGPTRQRRWVHAWVQAFAPADLIVYGAWRLKKPDVDWILSLGADQPAIRIWLVTHAGATALIASCARQCAAQWDLHLFLHRMRQTNRPRPHRAPTADAPGKPGPLRAGDPPRKMLPWPWGVPAAYQRSEPKAERLLAELNRIHRRLPVREGALEVATFLIHLFERAPDARRRAYVLSAVTDELFREGVFFRWHPALETLRIGAPWLQCPRPHPTLTSANPSSAAAAVLGALGTRQELRDFTAAPSATQILTSTGRVEQVPELLRPYVQAALIASAEGGPDSKPLRAWGSAPIRYSLLKPSSRFLDLATIASLIKVDPLTQVELHQDDLPAGCTQHQPAGEPEPLSLTQARILWEALQSDMHPQQELAWLAQPWTRWPHDSPVAKRQDIDRLWELGLIGATQPSANGLRRLTLAPWLEQLWVNKRVACPPIPTTYAAAEHLRATASG